MNDWRCTMRHPFRSFAFAIVGVILAATTAQAERPYRAPRTALGQPDLQGFWVNYSLTPLERPAGTPLVFPTRAEEEAFEAKARKSWHETETSGLGQGVSEWHEYYPAARIDGRLRASWIVSPSDGRLPWRSEALARFDALLAAALRDDASGPEARTPMDRCLSPGLSSAGPPMLNPSVGAGKQIVQTRETVAILSEMNHDLRIVRLAPAPARPMHAPAAIRPWMGDSVGWWEGETLVVETTNFHPQEAHRSHYLISPLARVTERFTRVSAAELRYVFEVDDPVNYRQVWRGEMPFRADTGPIFEYACHEGNYSMTNILAAARKADVEAAPVAP